MGKMAAIRGGTLVDLVLLEDCRVEMQEHSKRFKDGEHQHKEIKVGS